MLKVELISEDEYKTYLHTISQKKSNYYNDVGNRLKEIKEHIKKALSDASGDVSTLVKHGLKRLQRL